MNVLLELPGSEPADWNDFLENNNVIPNSRVKDYPLAGTIFVVNDSFDIKFLDWVKNEADEYFYLFEVVDPSDEIYFSKGIYPANFQVVENDA